MQYDTSRFDAILAQVSAGALTPIDEAEWRAYEQRMRKGGNGWKAGLSDDPVPGPYQPTGFAGFDAFVAACHVAFAYGASGPRTCVANREVGSLALDAPHDCHWLTLAQGDLWINLPKSTDFDNATEYVASLAHEMVHWAENHDPGVVVPELLYTMKTRGAASVGGLSEGDARKLSASTGNDPEALGVEDRVSDPPYVMAELAAEMGCALLLAATGVDPGIEDRIHYVQGYMGAIPPMYRETVVKMSVDRAKQAVANLLQHATTT
jgi:hypothetical protein